MDASKTDSTRITIRPRSDRARTLQRIVDQIDGDDAVRKSDLDFGDQVIVKTLNSVYSVWAMGDGTFTVSGGWFDKQKLSPMVLTINGCTYGGSAIRQDVVAGRGLCLEFGNRVATTRIQEVQVLRAASGADFGGASSC